MPNIRRQVFLYCALVGAGIMLSVPGVTLHARKPGDTTREPASVVPLYPPGKGPTVAVDEAHFNFHTIGGRYRDLARLLERDGYVVRPARTPFSGAALRTTRILIVATALSERNREPANWSLPVYSAFTDGEIRVLREWVRDGGSLLLIADHLPFAGAAQKLAAAFDFELINGYALDRREIHLATLDRPFVFTRDGKNSDGTLGDHAIIRGRNPSERIGHVMTFMGAAFRSKGPVSPLLTFGEHVSSYQTTTFGKLSATTPSVPAAGLMQAAARHYGKGRVVFFAEAGLFMGQTQGERLVGMNHPGASDNHQLLLNVMHWLDGTLK